MFSQPQSVRSTRLVRYLRCARPALVIGHKPLIGRVQPNERLLLTRFEYNAFRPKCTSLNPSP